MLALLHSMPPTCSWPPPTHTSAGDSGHSRASLVSLLWGHCSFLLGPGAHKVLFVPSKNLFPHSCVGSDSYMMGLMATSSKRAYAVPKSASPWAPAPALWAPAPAALHCWPIPPQETLKHSSVPVSVGSLGPGAHKVCLSPLNVSGRYVWF